VKTLTEANKVLKAQLFEAEKGGKTLAKDAQRLHESWQRLRREQEEKVRM